MIRRSFLSALSAWLPGSALLGRWRPETTGELPPASLWSYTAIGGKPLVEQVYDRVLAIAAEYPDLSVSTLYYHGKTGEFLPNYVSIGTRVQFEFENGGRYPMTGVRMLLGASCPPLVEWFGCGPCPIFFDREAFIDTIQSPTADSVDRAESILRRGLDSLRTIEFPVDFVRKNHLKYRDEIVSRGPDGVYRVWGYSRRGEDEVTGCLASSPSP